MQTELHFLPQKGRTLKLIRGYKLQTELRFLPQDDCTVQLVGSCWLQLIALKMAAGQC